MVLFRWFGYVVFRRKLCHKSDVKLWRSTRRERSRDLATTSAISVRSPGPPVDRVRQPCVPSNATRRAMLEFYVPLSEIGNRGRENAKKPETGRLSIRFFLFAIDVSGVCGHVARDNRYRYIDVVAAGPGHGNSRARYSSDQCSSTRRNVCYCFTVFFDINLKRNPSPIPVRYPSS